MHMIRISQHTLDSACIDPQRPKVSRAIPVPCCIVELKCEQRGLFIKNTRRGGELIRAVGFCWRAIAFAFIAIGAQNDDVPWLEPPTERVRDMVI